VPDEHLRLIVEAGILAPSGYNGQTTSFVVVSDTALLEPSGESRQTRRRWPPAPL